MSCILFRGTPPRESDCGPRAHGRSGDLPMSGSVVDAEGDAAKSELGAGAEPPCQPPFERISHNEPWFRARIAVRSGRLFHSDRGGGNAYLTGGFPHGGGGAIAILPNGFYSLSPDWRYLALVQYGSSGQYDQSLTLWDASSLLGRGTELALLAENIPIGREGSLNSTILFLPGMRSLAVFTYCPSCPETMMTEIYSIDPSSDYAAVFPMDVGGLPVVFVTAGGLFKDVAPYVDGVAALDWEGIKLLNVWSGETLSIDLPQAPWSVRLEVHPGGQLAAVLNPDGIQIFDIYAEQAIASIPWLEDNRLWSVAFSPDGRFLATADDRDVLVRSGSTYELIHAIPYSGERPVLTFSPDGSILAARGGATEIVLWNTETGQVVSRFAGASNLTFSPDGSLILVQRERDLVLWGLP